MRILRSKLRTDSRGAAIVELAVLMPFLIMLTVLTTDILLAILVKTQVQNAARAAGEFAINYGYDENGMTKAAQNAISDGQTALSSYILPLSTVSIAFLDPADVSLGSATYNHTPFCGCIVNTFSSSTPVAAISNLTGPTCGNGTASKRCTISANTTPVYAVPMVKIKVSVSYTPIFGSLWNYASGGVFSNFATVTVVTF